MFIMFIVYLERQVSGKGEAKEIWVWKTKKEEKNGWNKLHDFVKLEKQEYWEKKMAKKKKKKKTNTWLKNQPVFIISNRDPFSIWFYLNEIGINVQNLKLSGGLSIQHSCRWFVWFKKPYRSLLNHIHIWAQYCQTL